MLKPFKTPEYRGWFDPELDWTPSLPESKEFQAMVSKKGELLLHCRGRDIFRITFNLSGKPCRCFLYVFRNSSISRAFRTSPAHRIRIASKLIREAGFPSIEVLAALRPKKEWLSWHSLLVTREIPDVKELAAAGNHVYQVHESLPFTDGISRLTARELARFHDAGLFHGDLKSRHILVSSHPYRGQDQIFFVDLEKTGKKSLLPGFLKDLLASRDLIQLLSSLPQAAENPGTISGERFIDQYFASRNLRSSREARIRRALDLYRNSGTFRQGETILQAVLKQIRRTGNTRSSEIRK